MLYSWRRTTCTQTEWPTYLHLSEAVAGGKTILDGRVVLVAPWAAVGAGVAVVLALQVTPPTLGIGRFLERLRERGGGGGKNTGAEEFGFVWAIRAAQNRGRVASGLVGVTGAAESSGPSWNAGVCLAEGASTSKKGCMVGSLGSCIASRWPPPRLEMETRAFCRRMMGGADRFYMPCPILPYHVDRW